MIDLKQGDVVRYSVPAEHAVLGLGGIPVRPQDRFAVVLNSDERLQLNRQSVTLCPIVGEAYSWASSVPVIDGYIAQPSLTQAVTRDYWQIQPADMNVGPEAVQRIISSLRFIVSGYAPPVAVEGVPDRALFRFGHVRRFYNLPYAERRGGSSDCGLLAISSPDPCGFVMAVKVGTVERPVDFRYEFPVRFRPGQGMNIRGYFRCTSIVLLHHSQVEAEDIKTGSPVNMAAVALRTMSVFDPRNFAALVAKKPPVRTATRSFAPPLPR